MEKENQTEDKNAESGYTLLGVVKGLMNTLFIKEKIIEKEIIIYKNKYPKLKKSKQDKIFVGQFACHIHCGETGLICAGVCDYPSEVDYQIFCPFEDSIGLCTTEKTCDFKREVTDYDLRQHPDLFHEEQDEHLIEDED